MATAVERLLQTAKNEVGYLEKATSNLNYLYDKTKNAGSANYTKYGYEMHNIQPSNMDYPAPWCDAYYDWLHVKTFGVETARKLLYDFDDYTVNSVALYKKHGRWYTSNPKPGDQIFFNDSTGNVCHTGLVIKVDSSKVYTNEGNTSGASTVVANGGGVCEKSYSLNYSRIAGYGRPDYSLVKEEIDMEELKKLQKQVDEIQQYVNKQKTAMIYNYIDKNMPEWAREAVQWEVDNGIIKGINEHGDLGLTDNDLRQIVREYRFFKLITTAIK